MSDLPCQNKALMPLFFGETPAEQREAAAHCFTCPLMLKCGEEGRTEEYGVWGGTTEWDRPEAKALAEKLRKIERDNEILTLIRQGVTRDDIAERYQVAKRTVQRISAAARMQSTPDLIAA